MAQPKHGVSEERCHNMANNEATEAYYLYFLTHGQVLEARSTSENTESEDSTNTC